MRRACLTSILFTATLLIGPAEAIAQAQSDQTESMSSEARRQATPDAELGMRHPAHHGAQRYRRRKPHCDAHMHPGGCGPHGKPPAPPASDAHMHPGTNPPN